MNIVIIGPAHPFRGGIALFSERLAQQFQSEGHEVEIITFTTQYPNILFPGKTQFSESKIPENLKINRKINSTSPLNWLKVGRQIRKAQPDIVIFNYWMPFFAPCFGTIARQIKKNQYTKLLAITHNVIPHEKRIGDSALTKYFATKIDGFVVMSQQVMDDLKTFTSSTPAKLSPHPLYDNFGEIKDKTSSKNELGLSIDYSYLLFFGLIRQYKGLDTLINAFADERINKSKVKLIVAGEFYDDKLSYETLIQQHQLQDSVILVDKFIPDNEVVNYFCAADMVVQPYKTATQSGVTQIAYHFNKPMLVTDVGGLKEMIPNNVVGYVVEPNAASVANAIVDFYSNNKEVEFVKGVEIEKQKYAWSNMTKTLLSLLDA
ncbi:MAG: glycosyltransferase [Flavobacteriales bacterium]|nr:glycosyltransferase [Flavobacteriales bacterium]